MKIEITTEQFNQIQAEIIKLEKEFADKQDTMSGWDAVYYGDTIAKLKEILESEEIDLNELH